jgi:hypothetical protein
MKINKVKKLTESVKAKKAFIDQSGSLCAFKDKIDAKVSADGYTDLVYFDSIDYVEPLKAAKAGDEIVVYTNDDYKTNCPELAGFKNVVIKNITSEIKNDALTESEETIEMNDTDLVIDDIKSASVDDIADAVVAAKEEGTEGAETYSDANAKKVANEIKTYASGFDAAAWAPLDVPSELTDKLDDCLANALVSQHSGTHDGTDLLVDGLPGSGKTGIVRQWAHDRGVNLFYLNAKNDDLGAILNGFPVDTVVDKPDGDGQMHAVDRSYSFNTALKHLNEPRTALF